MTMLMYRDGRHYDAMNAQRVSDDQFYVERARRSGGPVLELCCGTGRLVLPIAASGIEVVGLDLAEGMLAEARRKSEKIGRRDIEWVKADCRDFSLGRKFKLIFVAFNSLLHLTDEKSWMQFFACSREHLAKGGQLIFDVFNPQLERMKPTFGEWSQVSSYFDPDGRGEIRIEERTRYIESAQWVQTEWRYLLDGKLNAFPSETMTLGCIFAKELNARIERNGFRIREKLGDFEGTPFGPESRRQVVVCDIV